MKTWIFKWKKNGFRSAQGAAVKNAGIIRCTSIQLDIRASYPQKIRLQYVKGHSGDVGNDGADDMANRGTLLPALEDRDWEALEMELSELEKSSVETNGVKPVPLEVEDIDDVENTVDETLSSSDFHEHESRTAMAVTTSLPIKPTSDPTASEDPSWNSSRSTSIVLPLLSAPREEKTGIAAGSPAQCFALPASARPQVIPLESPATVSSTDFEIDRDNVSSKASIHASEVNFDVGELLLFIIYILHLNRIMRIAYWMMKILPRNFLTRYCLTKTTYRGEGVRYVELQAVDQLFKTYYILDRNI